MLRWKRSLRTACSERFVAVRGGRAVGTADVHYLEDYRILGIVVLDEGAGWTDEQIADLLASLNEDMFPEADASKGTLMLTTVVGRMVVGQDSEGVPTRRAAPRGERPRRG
jgi:hypothetical protein